MRPVWLLDLASASASEQVPKRCQQLVACLRRHASRSLLPERERVAWRDLLLPPVARRWDQIHPELSLRDSAVQAQPRVQITAQTPILLAELI